MQRRGEFSAVGADEVGVFGQDVEEVDHQFGGGGAGALEVVLDDRQTGLERLFVLAGGGRKLWVWQNRTGWTDTPGATFTVKGIPPAAAWLEVYRYNSWDKPWKSLDVRRGAEAALTDLPRQETLMFLARPSG